MGGFLASLVREWKMLNVLSGFAPSVSNLPLYWRLDTNLWNRTILTVFQIQDAENDPLTCTAALCSLVSTLISLSFGMLR